MRRIRTKTFDMLSYVMRPVCTTFAFSWLYVMRGTAIIKKGRHFGKTTEAAAVNNGAFLYGRYTEWVPASYGRVAAGTPHIHTACCIRQGPRYTYRKVNGEGQARGTTG